MKYSEAQIRGVMRRLRQDCIDECDEVNATKLAEDACCELDAYINDDVIPEEFFEVAAEISCEYDNDKKLR